MTSAAGAPGWNRDTQYALGCYKLLGRALGIWPLGTHGIFAKIRFLFAIITLLILDFNITKNFITFGFCGTSSDFIDVLTLMLGGLVTIMKLIILKIKQKTLLFIVNSIIDDWSIVSKKSYIIMKQQAYIGRAVFFVQIYSTCAVALQFSLGKVPAVYVLLNDVNDSDSLQPLPIGPECWTTKSFTYLYVFNFIFETVQIVMLGMAYISCDTFFFGIVMHVCGQFEVLCMEIDSLNDINNWLEQKHVLRYSIKRHNQLLRLAQSSEELYNIVIAATIITDIIVASVSALVLLMNLNSKNYLIVIGLIVRIYVVNIQMFLYCYIGESLSTNAENLKISIYNSSWYRMPPDIVRDMGFIIMRNNYRLKLTAGKLYTMDIESFKNIVKTMSSYFAVLRLMFMEDQ